MQIIPARPYRNRQWHSLLSPTNDLIPLEWNGSHWIKNGLLYTPERLFELGYKYYAVLYSNLIKIGLLN